MLAPLARAEGADAVNRILVIGGYGGFGARLARRLAAAGHAVLVGGRDAAKGSAFAATLARAEGVCVDRDGDVGAVLARLKPDLLVDAAGPFQGSDYRVAEACLAAGIPYLDLADGRAFVTGFAGLDERARGAGIAMVSGASSVPALSGAAARQLAAGLDRVTRVDIAISASARATASRSVTGAVLSYAGRPIRVWRGRRWEERPGCGDLRRELFALPGSPRLRRLCGLCDVPDLDLLPALLPGRPAVTFRAGPERALQMRLLAAASLLVRWGWARSLRGLTLLALRAQKAMRLASSDRSAMAVNLWGWRGDTPVERRWTLIAEHGDGPEIPTLAACLLAERLLAGEVPAGARDAAGLLDLADFEPLFAGLAIRHAVVETIGRDLLYRRVMGAAFDRLPSLVRTIHQVHGDAGASGEGSVRRGGGPAGRAVAWFGGFPPAGDYPLHVSFEENDGVERWTRRFGPHRFDSRLSEDGGKLVERFGPMRFAFDLPADATGLAMRLTGWSLFGMKLPRFLAPRIDAREWQEEDRFHLHVAIAMPLIGEVVRYDGWLRPAD
jgi:hypothetical protein